jgi:hypothetical protein
MMKKFGTFPKLFVFTVFFAVFAFTGISISSYDSQMVIAGIQEPPPSPPVDPDPPPPPPDPFTAV